LNVDVVGHSHLPGGGVEALEPVAVIAGFAQAPAVIDELGQLGRGAGGLGAADALPHVLTIALNTFAVFLVLASLAAAAVLATQPRVPVLTGALEPVLAAPGALPRHRLVRVGEAGEAAGGEGVAVVAHARAANRDFSFLVLEFGSVVAIFSHGSPTLLSTWLAASAVEVGQVVPAGTVVIFARYSLHCPLGEYGLGTLDLGVHGEGVGALSLLHRPARLLSGLLVRLLLGGEG